MSYANTTDSLKRYYEEQIESQRGMLTSAIGNLGKKRSELEHALKKVERQNQELNQISDRMFHNMREPMVTLLGLVEMLKTESESDAVSYLVKLTEATVKRLDHFSLSLASYIRIIQKDFESQKIDTSSFFNELIQSVETVEGRDKVKICVDRKSLDMHRNIQYDPEKLQLVLQNLIRNAIRFRDVDKENQRIDITFKNKLGRTIIKIQDNGMGINTSVLRHVTEMFYKGSNKSDGNGLGLYLVKNVLEEKGDHVRIWSEEGKGTSVFIILNCNQQT